MGRSSSRQACSCDPSAFRAVPDSLGPQAVTQGREASEVQRERPRLAVAGKAVGRRVLPRVMKEIERLVVRAANDYAILCVAPQPRCIVSLRISRAANRGAPAVTPAGSPRSQRTEGGPPKCEPGVYARTAACPSGLGLVDPQIDVPAFHRDRDPVASESARLVRRRIDRECVFKRIIANRHGFGPAARQAPIVTAVVPAGLSIRPLLAVDRDVRPMRRRTLSTGPGRRGPPSTQAPWPRRTRRPHRRELPETELQFLYFA